MDGVLMDHYAIATLLMIDALWSVWSVSCPSAHYYYYTTTSDCIMYITSTSYSCLSNAACQSYKSISSNTPAI
jgi:hypothetical protein